MLEKGRYLNLNNVDLNRSLRRIYLQDIEKFIELIDFLKDSERYELDFLFSLIVDIEEISYYTITGEIKNYQDKLDDLFDRLENTAYFETMTLCLNILANAYSVLNKLEETIACYTLVIELEKSRDEVGISSAIANHNIGQLYAFHQNKKKALQYTIRANNIMSDLPNGKLEYDSLWIFITSELSALYLDLEDFDNGFYYYELAKKNKPEGLSGYSGATFHRLEMQVNFLRGDLAKVNYEYEILAEYLIKQNDFDALIAYAVSYYQYYSKLAGVTDELIHKIESALQITKGRGSYKDELVILNVVIDYYLKNNNVDKARPYIKRIYSQVQDYYQQSKKETMKKIDINHQKYIYTEGLAREQSKQKELQRRYQENEKKNNGIRELNKRLSVIRNICKDILTANEYESLFYNLYRNIKDFISIDSFNIMSFEQDGEILETKLNYNENGKNIYQEIKLGKETPFLAEFIANKNTLICSNEADCVELLKELKVDFQYNSAIISPMIFKGKPIALAYVLSKKEDAYKEIPKEFVIQISIYMSIVIYNINRKIRLVKIIEENKQTKAELEQANLKLKELSEKDSLTGINNRLAFYNFYYEKLKFAQENQKIISLYMIDIDYFKRYNDHYGHVMGDQALIHIAELLSEHFNKAKQISARFGGEEFIAFSIDDNFDEAYQRAESLRKKVEQLKIEHIKSDHQVLTVSIGVASIKELSLNNDSYIGIADKALYEAKSSGRNKVVHIVSSRA